VISCPALFISAPASNQGKTTVTAGLARYHRNLGRTVRVFKTGPDFLDPMILARASGHPVYQLDLFMGGEAHCRELLWQAAQTADLILIEGVMGLFDGVPSSADLATTFGVPVLAVIDAGAMAQTFGALAHGLSSYRADLPFAGVLANRVASAGHADMLKTSVRADTHYYGALFRDADMTLPERHLGLVQADEIADLEVRLDLIASKFADTDLAQLPPAVTFTAPPADVAVPALLQGVRIAVARDDAFAFIYPANLNTLRALGAELSFFSPLADTELPPADALYLPGGYPELHLDTIANNTAIRDSIRQHHAAGKAIVAECGGMLALLDSLTDKDGKRAEMMRVMPSCSHTSPR
jgi:cobyrinic acid a,c-diamide synthase